MTLTQLPAGDHGLLSARPEPDLGAVGYEESEHLLTTERGTTRVVVRRPLPGLSRSVSGTLLVEWLNVSSGSDAAPDWTFAADEILRAGHAWAGVSAQHVGAMGGVAAVAIDAAPTGGLRGRDPERYAAIDHPGDTHSYDFFTAAALAVRALVGADVVLAVGESQSAALLTTYANEVQPRTGTFDGFLVHSRPAVAAPLVLADEQGPAMRMDEMLGGGPVLFRDDLGVPVLVVQTEGDLFDRIGFLPARQPDTDRFRLWEVAGAAHADGYVIGEFESFLGCVVPVNRGQQWVVVRAAVRALDQWVRDGVAPPAADRLEVDADGTDFVRDEHGLVRGGVRTPAVDAPADVVSGRPWPDSTSACRLFGSTTPLAAPAFASHADYLAAYEAATDAMVAAGFACPEDRDALLAEARPDRSDLADDPVSLTT
ncbi:alpha/beta hydrolase domain-containing protein [Nocardioides sp.]|uniref:alpha/beta hydrolase domain-containing protein n=1 Tax=Nocardioides sp. TaxID=35761 RepID=UPI00271C14DE|nr:alpha/beta hydrolase domain-containing protein [Nocardioides sp.]MDO9456434.1 alpha/beta hydrolase domain-containing protein [Nocardioides sp.]